MALTITPLVTLFTDDVDRSSYNITAFTPTASRLLVAMIYGNGANGLAAPGTLGESHLTWTLRAHIDNGAARWIEIWTANVDGSPGSITLVRDLLNSVQGCGATVWEVSGHDTAKPIRQTASNGTTAANPTMTFPSALLTGNAYIAGFTINRTVPSSTPPTSWTETADNGYVTPTQGMSNAYRVNGETGTVVTFTALSGGYLALGIEINADPGATAYPRVGIIGG